MTWLAIGITVFAAAMTCYYILLYVLADRTSRIPRDDVADPDAMFVIAVPARNEAVVIERTIERLLQLHGDNLMVLVMDDGSDDGTGDIAARAVAGDPSCTVVRRTGDIAGRGKGDVLNHAYRIVRDLVDDADPRMRGATADQVYFGILDADGWLDRDTLPAVARCFHDERVAGVQLPVRMWNAPAGFLARMQDMEFVAYGHLFQAGRERLGSVLMGGNGQFVRLSALQTLGNDPWTDSLTEDLDIGLRLVARGWRHRFCADAFVAQQALCTPRAFVRQRTRWVQGHLECWSHLPVLWRRSSDIPMLARLDLTLHLLLGVFGVIGCAQLLLFLAAALHVIALPQFVNATSMAPQSLATLLAAFTLAPVLLVGACYQRAASARVPLSCIAGLLLVYSFYHYFWGAPATVRAISRIVTRRRAWAKTARALITHHDLAADAAGRKAVHT